MKRLLLSTVSSWPLAWLLVVFILTPPRSSNRLGGPQVCRFVAGHRSCGLRAGRVTNPKLRFVTASADTAIDRAQVAHPVDRTHVADPVIDRTNKTDRVRPQACSAAVHRWPVDDCGRSGGNIVTANRPLRLEPKSIRRSIVAVTS
jgi:hypothetical protein